MDFQNISSILSNPSWDLIVLFFFLAVGFFYGISAGKSKLISILFSVYVGGFLFDNFIYIDKLIKGRNITEILLFKFFAFFIVVLVLNVLFSRVIYLSDDKKWWHALLLSFSITGLLFSYLFHLFPAKDVFIFSPVVKNIFASNNSFFGWLILPLAALFFARK